MSTKQVVETIKTLPDESLNELASFIEYLRFKYQHKARSGKQSIKAVRLRDLKGILKGYDFPPELINQARREMWSGLGREHLLELNER